jgi:hypothetical protein
MTGAARQSRFLPDGPQLAVQVGPRPPDLVMMPVRQRAAKPAEGDDVSVTGSRSKDERVPAPDCEPDPFADWQVLQS